MATVSEVDQLYYSGHLCASPPSQAYVIAMHQTLSDGYVGTEECIWAIIHKRFPHLFKRCVAANLAPLPVMFCLTLALAPLVEKFFLGCGRMVFSEPLYSLLEAFIDACPVSLFPPFLEKGYYHRCLSNHTEHLPIFCYSTLGVCSFDNNSLGNHGDNCASFQKSMMIERDLKQGSAKV